MVFWKEGSLKPGMDMGVTHRLLRVGSQADAEPAEPEPEPLEDARRSLRGGGRGSESPPRAKRSAPSYVGISGKHLKPLNHPTNPNPVRFTKTRRKTRERKTTEPLCDEASVLSAEVWGGMHKALNRVIVECFNTFQQSRTIQLKPRLTGCVCANAFAGCVEGNLVQWVSRDSKRKPHTWNTHT